MQTNKRNFITLLKVIACILITNSHCRQMYPLYFLAIGGSFGNALFFLISGYCIVNIQSSFLEWYIKRLKRIALPTCLIVLISVCINWNSFITQNLMETMLFIVDSYWFVFAIAIYYIFYYFIFYNKSKNQILGSIVIYTLLYSFLYLYFNSDSFWIELEGFSLFKVYFYLGIFIWGGYIRLYINNKLLQEKKYLITLHLTLFFSLFIWVLTYFTVTVLQTLFCIQIFIHISIVFFCTSTLLLAAIYLDKIKILSGKSGEFFSLIADSTLEIYFIQVTLIQYCLLAPFPINWLIFWATAFLGGILFHKLIVALQRR